MSDEKTNVTGTEVEDMTQDYVAAINELKQNNEKSSANQK